MRAWRAAGRFWRLLAFSAIGLLAPLASAAAAPVPLPGLAAYPPIGVPVNTLVQLNSTGLRAIVIGSSYYDTDYVVDEVVLRRSDLAEVANYLWDGPHAAAGALNDIAHRSDADFVVIAAGPSPVAAGDWSQVFKALGATPVGNVSDGDWSVIGVPGASSGGWSNSQGAIEGYFQHDRTGPYVFEPKERIGVDLDAPGASAGQNIMRVGSSTYPSGPLVGTGKVTRGCATAGFQVVVLDAVTLKLKRPGSKTFATNGCGFFSDSAGVDDLAIYLAQLARSSSRLLVLVQSIGHPLMDPTTLPGLWGLVDQEMAAVGGTPTVLETDTGSYSLIGSVGIPSFPLAESSQSALAAVSNNPNRRPRTRPRCSNATPPMLLGRSCHLRTASSTSASSRPSTSRRSPSATPRGSSGRSLTSPCTFFTCPGRSRSSETSAMTRRCLTSDMPTATGLLFGTAGPALRGCCGPRRILRAPARISACRTGAGW